MNKVNYSKSKTYPLDNSGIIHLAARTKHHVNTFRFAARLKEEIRPDVLQKAVERIIPRFPMIAAGIETGLFEHRIVPVTRAPKVMPAKTYMAVMSKEEIKECAFRVLYSGKKICIEVFHALTDGYGGMHFLNTLTAEYLRLANGAGIPFEKMVLDPMEAVKQEEVTDDFFTYAGKEAAPLKQKTSFQLPGKVKSDHKIQVTIQNYPVKQLLEAAHAYQVSLNTFLTTVMVKAIAEIQMKHTGSKKKAIQLLVPINLRNLFPSKTLHNFSLFATPRIEEKEQNGSFEELLQCIEVQLKEQFTKENLSAVMARNTKLEKHPVLKRIPLFIKCFILKIVHHFISEQTSCMTFSNLGRMPMPDVMTKYVEGIEVYLTPRISSPYNCGTITYGDCCSVIFSRLCEEPELEICFAKNLRIVMECVGVS